MKKPLLSSVLCLTLGIGGVNAYAEGEAEPASRVQTVADVLEKPGVLTPKGMFVLDTSFSYTQNTSNDIDVIGYTVLPALLVGLIQAASEERTTLTLGLGMRYGFTNRWEGEIRVPFIYGHIERSTDDFNATADGTAESETSSFSGGNIGDIEVGLKYQFNLDSPPYYIGSLRYKSTTGKHPYEIDLNDEVPTGSGFHSIEPGLTLIQPIDPAVLFANISYIYNFGDTYTVRNDDGSSTLYDVTLGDSIAIRAGMGFAVNPDFSFSLGLAHKTILESDLIVDGENQDSSMLQLDTINFGINYRFTPSSSMNVSATAGLTEDAPDFQLSVNFPISF